jgi:ATP-dependent metalloprotease
MFRAVYLLPRNARVASLSKPLSPSFLPARVKLRNWHSTSRSSDVAADASNYTNESPQTHPPLPADVLKNETPALHRLLFELSDAEFQAEASIGIVQNVLQNKATVDAYVRFLDAQLQREPSAVLRAFERLGMHNPVRAEALVSYVRALAASQREGHVSKLLHQAFSSSPGSSSASALHVIAHQTRSGTVLSIIGIVLSIAVIVVLYLSIVRGTNSAGGGAGGGLGSVLNSKQYKPVEKDMKVTFADVKGNYEAKEELTDLVAYLKQPHRFANVKVPKGVLMVGPPGTGKTLMARALAGEAGVPFINASGSEFEEVFVGLGARRVRQLFEEARKKAPCIVFIDEIDAVGGSRDNTVSKAMNMTLNQLLVELDGFSSRDGVILIGATNMPSHLDPALVRPGRFDRKVHLGLPGQNERKEIVDYYLSKHVLSEDVDPFAIARATAGFSGADLENMVNWAAIEAIKEDRTNVDTELLDRALLNVAMGREKKSMVISPKVRRIIAYHEGGHALVALHSKGAHEIRSATLIPRGEALGMVGYLPSDEHLTTREELLCEMRTAMGGRAAEELIFGSDQVTTGASSDFQKATRVAQAMVTRYGMSDKVGHLHVASDDDGPRHRQGGSSGAVADSKLVADEVKVLVESAYAQAKSLLQEHEVELHRLADALLTHETLSKEEIARVIRGDMLVERGQREMRERALRAERKRVREAAEAKSVLGRSASDGNAQQEEQEAARAALHARTQ